MQVGKPEENAKLQAPANSSSAKESVVHEESVCTVTGLSTVFFTTQLTKDVEVPFDKNVWNKCKATQKGRLFSDGCWRNEVIEGLKKANVVCSFAFKRHCVTLRHNESKQQVFFRCEGYCTFSTCKVTFNCYINKHFQLHAKFEGTVLHFKSEKACLYIRGSDRKVAKEVLKHKLPRLHHLEW